MFCDFCKNKVENCCCCNPPPLTVKMPAPCVTPNSGISLLEHDSSYIENNRYPFENTRCPICKWPTKYNGNIAHYISDQGDMHTIGWRWGEYEHERRNPCCNFQVYVINAKKNVALKRNFVSLLLVDQIPELLESDFSCPVCPLNAVRYQNRETFRSDYICKNGHVFRLTQDRYPEKACDMLRYLPYFDLNVSPPKVCKRAPTPPASSRRLPEWSFMPVTTSSLNLPDLKLNTPLNPPPTPGRANALHTPSPTPLTSGGSPVPSPIPNNAPAPSALPSQLASAAATAATLTQSAVMPVHNTSSPTVYQCLVCHRTSVPILPGSRINLFRFICSRCKPNSAFSAGSAAPPPSLSAFPVGSASGGGASPPALTASPPGSVSSVVASPPALTASPPGSAFGRVALPQPSMAVSNDKICCACSDKESRKYCNIPPKRGNTLVNYDLDSFIDSKYILCEGCKFIWDKKTGSEQGKVNKVFFESWLTERRKIGKQKRARVQGA